MPSIRFDFMASRDLISYNAAMSACARSPGGFWVEVRDSVGEWHRIAVPICANATAQKPRVGSTLEHRSCSFLMRRFPHLPKTSKRHGPSKQLVDGNTPIIPFLFVKSTSFMLKNATQIPGKHPHVLNSQWNLVPLRNRFSTGFHPPQEPVLAADFPSTPKHGAAATAGWGVPPTRKSHLRGRDV